MDEYELTPLLNADRRAALWQFRNNPIRDWEYWMTQALKARRQRGEAREIAYAALAMLLEPYGPNGVKASEVVPRDIRELAARFAQGETSNG